MPARPSLRSALPLLLVPTLAWACSTTVDPASDAGAPDATTADATPTATGTGTTPPPPPPTDSGPPAADCTKAADCPSKVCDIPKGKCVEATCKDGVRNGTETDTDCGGGVCDQCQPLKSCANPNDCTSGVCLAYQCRAPACDDSVKNGPETDTDCGGPCAKCGIAKRCNGPADCETDVCVGGRCARPFCSDGVKNNAETDVDCGGGSCPRCSDAKSCLTGADCTSNVCADTGTGLKCQPPSCTDGIKNGTESDVDCGGAGCPGCAVGKVCRAGTDCASQGCNYKGVCAQGRSCTTRFGGDTCGLGGDGSVGPEAWEDCCAKATIAGADGPVKLDKYQVTAGRMRVFLEAVGYNVRAFVQQARAANKIPDSPSLAGRSVLDPAWDGYLPVSWNGQAVLGELSGCARDDYSGGCFQNVIPGVYTATSRHVGGFLFQQTTTPGACMIDPANPGSHAFRFPAAAQDGAPPEHSQDLYDTKAMQCVDYLLAQAFCVWEGGRLETLYEWQVAVGAGPYPWSGAVAITPRALVPGYDWMCHFPWVTDAAQGACSVPWPAATQTTEYAAYRSTYEYPKFVAADAIVYLSAPGRTRGRGPEGHADLLGNVYEMTSDMSAFNASPLSARTRWAGNGTWETNAFAYAGGPTLNLLEKTARAGLRCAFPTP